LHNGTQLQQLLGAWLATYEKYWFWHWHQPDPEHLLFCHSPMKPPCIGIKTQQHQTMMKFSPTIPTDSAFQGPPVTPMDINTGYICLLVPPLPQMAPELRV